VGRDGLFLRPVVVVKNRRLVDHSPPREKCRAGSVDGFFQSFQPIFSGRFRMSGLMMAVSSMVAAGVSALDLHRRDSLREAVLTSHHSVHVRNGERTKGILQAKSVQPVEVARSGDYRPTNLCWAFFRATKRGHWFDDS
jgi:hypothetical protein